MGFRSVDSEVAVDILGIPQSLQVYVPRTLDIAKACFEQALMDTLKAKGNEILEAGDPGALLPTTGRFVYKAAIDWNQASNWLATTEGKEFLRKTMKKAKEALKKSEKEGEIP